MKTYPNKLIVMFPMRDVRDYRQTLVAIDDALVVHRDLDGVYAFELRPMVKLTAKRTNGAAAVLQRLSDDLRSGHTVVMVERDQFVDDLAALARLNATDKTREEIETAIAAVIEAKAHLLRDHLETDVPQYKANRLIVGARERCTKAKPGTANGYNYMYGVPTPRAEQMWHVLRHEWTDPRDNAQGRSNWERWCGSNRPAMIAR